MRVLKLIILFGALTTVLACHYPARDVSIGGDASTIEFIGNTKGAYLFVNGIELGEISKLVTKNEKLEVPNGASLVLVKKDGNVVHDSKVFLSAGENKQIQIP